MVQKAKRSPAARAKAAGKRTHDDLPVHSFRTLLADLGTLTAMQVADGDATFTMLTKPTPVQQRSFELLESPRKCSQYPTPSKPIIPTPTVTYVRSTAKLPNRRAPSGTRPDEERGLRETIKGMKTDPPTGTAAQAALQSLIESRSKLGMEWVAEIMRFL